MNPNSKKDTFFGHPRGLSTLFFTEMWERFSYYGMKAILLYYMYYSVTQGGLGFNKVTAASMMSIYGSLVYLSSVAGGFVSDRLLGSFKTVLIGGILIMLGHIVLATPFGATALFSSMFLIILGTGFLKPNVSDMVGALYSKEDKRRDSAFSIFVFGINFGAFIAPYLVGTLGQEVNFHLGFSLAALGMAFGLIKYWKDSKKYLPSVTFKPTAPIARDDLKPIIKKSLLAVILIVIVVAAMIITGRAGIDDIINLLTIVAVLVPLVYFVIILRSQKITKDERSKVWAYVPLFIASMLFWSIEEQGSVVLALFADDQTRLTLDILGFSFNFPSSYFQSLNPLFIMLYVPFFAWLWTKLGSKQPSSPVKFSYGLVIAGLSFVWMTIPILLFGANVRVSPIWLIVSWAIVIVAEMLISPIGLSITNKLAPRAFQAQMMSIWFLSNSAAQAINAQIVRFYTKGTEVAYFGIVGLITVLFGILLFFYAPKIKQLMLGNQ